MKSLLPFLTCSLIAVTQLPAQVPSTEIPAIALIRDGLRSRQISSRDLAGLNNDSIKDIADGERRTILDVKGAGVIHRIWITMAPGSDTLSRNDVILRMYWDGNKSPSVASPIGPFFGQGWNESYPFISAPLAASPGGAGGASLISYFAMPFASGARIEIENQSGITISNFYYNIDYSEMESLPEEAGRFHAWFNREITEAPPEGENEWGTLGKTGSNTTGAKNYLIADITGHGQFVGVNYYVQSPGPMWYGEGNEMAFIDGESSPSYVGTGTEDYFNMSWSPRQIYQHPYFGLARAAQMFGWIGRYHDYRFHIPDPIYFDKSLKFTIEHGHNNVLTLDIATVAYWYQSNAVGVPAIPDKAGRKLMPEIGIMDIHRWRDAWRKQMGNGPRLWGNEQAPTAQP